jgi:hypothetical protein
LSIAFAEVATHNHFVLDRGGKIFKQTAPIIKLAPTKTEDDHLALLAYLNSSTACFWMKQVFMNKGGSGIGRGIQDEAWESRFQFDGTKLGTMPVPAESPSMATSAAELTGLAGRIAPLLREGNLVEAEKTWTRMVAVQENIDWEIYAAVGLIDGETIEMVRSQAFESLAPGCRPFEWLLVEEARNTGRMTAWFERNDYAEPTGEIPRAVAVRLDIIARTPELQLIERPEFKRRWTVPAWRGVRPAALRQLVLDECERLLSDPLPLPLRSLFAKISESHGAKLALGELDISGTDGLSELLSAESVPYISPHVFNEAGQTRFEAWQRAWDLQRRQDAGEICEVPVPARFDSDDYRSPVSWRLRGRLNVPKERFISYPGLERGDDKSPLFGWAGWDYLQRAQALAAIFQERKEHDGWPREGLLPILAGLLELVPWLKQWHNEPDPTYDGQRMGDVYEAFVSEKARGLQATLDELRAWRPADSRAGSGKGKAKSALKLSKTRRTSPVRSQ